MTRCGLHDAEMEVHRYRGGEVTRCPRGCVIQTPNTRVETVAPLVCAFAGCDTVIPPRTGGNPRKYCSSRHRLAAMRLRRNAEHITEAPR